VLLAEDIFVRALIFRLFNRIETWRQLEQTFERIDRATFDVDAYGSRLDELLMRGERIYSAAYIMPSGKSAFGHQRKHRNHLALIKLMLRTDLPAKIADARSLEGVYELLLAYPTLGPFLAFQLTIDLNYSKLCDFSEMDFVVAGPGAQSGIRKCFVDVGAWSYADVIRYVTDRQNEEFEKHGEQFLSLWGRPLQLIDVQNLFCEIDKYARVKHPEVAGLGRRTRIKRTYSPAPTPIDYWFPPKWGINDAVATRVIKPTHIEA
jgi:hypothetical protein